MVQVTVQRKGGKPVELTLDGTVHQVTVADVKRGVQKQVTKVSQVMVPVSRTRPRLLVVASELGNPCSYSLTVELLADIQFVPNRQRLTLVPAGKEKPTALTEDNKSLADYGLSGSNVTIRLKDLGYQVAYRALYLWEYVSLPLHYRS